MFLLSTFKKCTRENIQKLHEALFTPLIKNSWWQNSVKCCTVRWDLPVPWHYVTPIRRLWIWQVIGPNALTNIKKKPTTSLCVSGLDISVAGKEAKRSQVERIATMRTRGTGRGGREKKRKLKGCKIMVDVSVAVGNCLSAAHTRPSSDRSAWRRSQGREWHESRWAAHRESTREIQIGSFPPWRLEHSAVFYNHRRG